jgi:hypothetical protein
MESSSTEFYYWKIVSTVTVICLYSINFLIKKKSYDNYSHEIELLQTKIARTNNNDLLFVLKFIENAENTLPYFAIKKIEYNKNSREIIIKLDGAVNIETKKILDPDNQWLMSFSKIEPNLILFKKKINHGNHQTT